MLGSQAGIKSLLTIARAADVIPFAGRPPKTLVATSFSVNATRAAFSTAPQCSASFSAAYSCVWVCSMWRKCFISTPVLIPSGHAMAQEPSPAHVSMASYS